MAQCYQCGSSVEMSDRYCMECGADYPAHPPAAPALSQGAEALVGAALPAPPLPSLAQATPLAPPPLSPAPPAPGAPPQPTMPTWLPVEAVPASLQPPASMARPSGAFNAPQAASIAQEAATFPCPNCGANLPQGARFCGDCGERMPTASTSFPTLPVPPARSPSAALPEPIPPLIVGPPLSPAASPAQPMLPAFHAPGWAVQPAPDVEIPDNTQTPPPVLDDPQAAPITPSPWNLVAPIGAPFPGSLPGQAANPMMQPAPWPPAQPQGPGGVGLFQSPFDPTQRVGGIAPFPAPPPDRAMPPPSPFLQALTAVPPLTPRRRRQPLPRGQVITMIIVAIVTVGATIGGLLTLFLSR